MILSSEFWFIVVVTIIIITIVIITVNSIIITTIITHIMSQSMNCDEIVLS